jgi:hypothetical protein
MATAFKSRKMKINKVSFRHKGMIAIELQDGRIFLVPLDKFPDIQRLTPSQRRMFTIVDDRSLFFRKSEYIYHLEDFIGLESKWRER